MDKRTAEKLACLIAAEFISDTAHVETVIEREGITVNDQDANLLAEALELLYSELLERSNSDETDPVLQERYKRLEAELEQEDHTELIARARKSAAFWDEELSS